MGSGEGIYVPTTEIENIKILKLKKQAVASEQSLVSNACSKQRSKQLLVSNTCSGLKLKKQAVASEQCL
eukprot:2460689-Ditylum_brightwellii.AAC.1